MGGLLGGAKGYVGPPPLKLLGGGLAPPGPPSSYAYVDRIDKRKLEKFRLQKQVIYEWAGKIVFLWES